MQNGVSLQTKTENTPKMHADEDISTIFNSVFDVELATSPEAINEVFEVRYQVYCIDRPFEDPNCFVDKREHDIYDARSAHALIRHRVSGHSVATVRLILAGENPEQAEFPMEEPCVHRMDQYAQEAIAKASRNHVAEISRMAVNREFRRRLNEDRSAIGVSEIASYQDSENGKRAVPYIILGLLALIVQMSVNHGVTHWMAVMEPALLRILKRFGVEFDHVGPVVEYHGLRRPTFTEAATLVEGIKKRRPDVWSLITDGGKHLPSKPDSE